MDLKPRQPGRSAGGADSTGRAVAEALIITADGVALRRRLGPLACMVLEHLALCSHRIGESRAVPVGVRDIACGIGVTKDTAARSLSTLVAAGLVTRDRVDAAGGRRRSGYLLHLPDHMRLIDRPDRADVAVPSSPSEVRR